VACNEKIRASKAALSQSNSKGDVASQVVAERVSSVVHDEKLPGDVAYQAENSLHHVKDNVESKDAQSDAAGRDEDACVIGYKMSVENYDVSRILSEGVGAVEKQSIGPAQVESSAN
jgi:hypothetical protein